MLILSRQQIVETARKYLGTPFHLQGRRRGIGLDCAGLVLCVAQELGIPLLDKPEFRNWSRVLPVGSRLVASLDEQCRKKSFAETGDIIVMTLRRTRWAQHLAIKSPIGLIHTHTLAKQVVEHAMTAEWSTRVLAVYEYPGVVWRQSH